MARFHKGDKVIITEGEFDGRWGVIVDKDVIGDELTVALGDDGREIRTHEAHVNKVEDD
jgi:transcription antitermination factor NusG